LGIVKPIGTGRIAENLYAVKTGPVNFFVYKKETDCIALDSGLDMFVVKRELAELGINPASVSAVFLSHTDFDHVGGLPAFPDAAIYLSHNEEQLIVNKTARKAKFIYNKNINRPYSLLNDGEIITIGGIKIKALETPGHTIGSMSYIVDNEILFVGDTFTYRDGHAQPVVRFLNMDNNELEKTLRRLGTLEGVQLALTSHRGFTTEFRNAMERWQSV